MNAVYLSPWLPWLAQGQALLVALPAQLVNSQLAKSEGEEKDTGHVLTAKLSSSRLPGGTWESSGRSSLTSRQVSRLGTQSVHKRSFCMCVSVWLFQLTQFLPACHCYHFSLWSRFKLLHIPFNRMRGCILRTLVCVVTITMRLLTTVWNCLKVRDFFQWLFFPHSKSPQRPFNFFLIFFTLTEQWNEKDVPGEWTYLQPKESTVWALFSSQQSVSELTHSCHSKAGAGCTNNGSYIDTVQKVNARKENSCEIVQFVHFPAVLPKKLFGVWKCRKCTPILNTTN